MTKFKSSLLYLLMIPLAALSALNYKLFVFPNSFAPSGIDGVCTMIQYLLGTNIGYLSLIFNIPLLLIAYFAFKVKRDYIFKTSIYVIAFSIASIILGFFDLSRFTYFTENGTSIVLSPIVAGVIRGLLYAVTLKAEGSSGGVDIIAAMIKTKRPHYNLMNIIFACNVVVALMAYLVYGFKVEPVVCSIIYAYVTSAVSKFLGAVGREKVRFEIITSDAEQLCKIITEKPGMSATLVNARGGYSGDDKKMLICVTTKERTPILEKIVSDFGDAVVFESTVSTALTVHHAK